MTSPGGRDQSTDVLRWHRGPSVPLLLTTYTTVLEETNMRVPDEMLQCVCFLCMEHKGTYKYGGTGFFMSVPSEKNSDDRHVYLITAKHCIERAQQYGDIRVRLNTPDGRAEVIQIDTEWLFSDNEASDVAILPWPRVGHLFQYKYIARGMSLTDEVVKEQGVGVGDDVVIVGLFSQHYGTQRNIPIVRSGIISAMPVEPLEDPDSGLEYNAYLSEIRSIGGLSGSPVFAVLGPSRVHDQKVEMTQRTYLLGLVRGHWDIKPETQPLNFTQDELQAVNMGIAIITPIQDALEIIDREELVKARRQLDMERLKSRTPTEDLGHTKD